MLKRSSNLRLACEAVGSDTRGFALLPARCARFPLWLNARRDSALFLAPSAAFGRSCSFLLIPALSTALLFPLFTLSTLLSHGWCLLLLYRACQLRRRSRSLPLRPAPRRGQRRFRQGTRHIPFPCLQCSLFPLRLIRLSSQVRVVEHKRSKELYALKYIEKAKCIKQKAVANIIQERRLLEEVRPAQQRAQHPVTQRAELYRSTILSSSISDTRSKTMKIASLSWTSC